MQSASWSITKLWFADGFPTFEVEKAKFSRSKTSREESVEQ